MSEYQYYEFRAIEKLLTERQLREIEKISTRAELTESSFVNESESSFVNEYHYGDFKGDPRKFLEKYYDAFFYFANWGTRELVLRFPLGILDAKALAPYLCEEVLETWKTKTHLFIRFYAYEESGEWDIDYDAELSDYLPLRDELMRGDFRALYLTWLYAAHTEIVDPDAMEPPVPDGLQKLTSAQRKLAASFFGLDKGLVAAAATASTRAEPRDDQRRQDGSLDQEVASHREECPAGQAAAERYARQGGDPGAVPPRYGASSPNAKECRQAHGCRNPVAQTQAPPEEMSSGRAFLREKP